MAFDLEVDPGAGCLNGEEVGGRQFILTHTKMWCKDKITTRKEVIYGNIISEAPVSKLYS